MYAGRQSGFPNTSKQATWWSSLYTSQSTCFALLCFCAGLGVCVHSVCLQAYACVRVHVCRRRWHTHAHECTCMCGCCCTHAILHVRNCTHGMLPSVYTSLPISRWQESGRHKLALWYRGACLTAANSVHLNKMVLICRTTLLVPTDFTLVRTGPVTDPC